MQAISAFGAEVEQLEIQKKVGSRDIDSIDEDIAKLKADILLLQRKYINYFYYF